MPNHFHLLLRQLEEGGIQEFANKISNSYTKYFNTKYKRVGPLFQGAFKAVSVETDEQLTHLSRYIHLNPYVSNLTDQLTTFTHSSYPEFIGLSNKQLCTTEPILSFFKDKNSYKKFVTDHQDYALRLAEIKHLLLDIE